MSGKIKNNTIYSYNPVNNNNLGKIKITSSKEINDIINNSKNNIFWKQKTLKKRIQVLKQFRKGIVSHMDELINLIKQETGKKDFEALIEIFNVLEHLKESSKTASKCLKDEKRKSGLLKTKKALVRYEPKGIIGIISPWNYPLILTLTPMVEALLSGNNVIIKPSEHTSLCAQLIKKIWDEKTKLSDTVQFIYGSGDVGNQLVEHHDINMICFIGSTKIGKIIAYKCAQSLKPYILELGGKDPMIILDDANIERATNAALWGGLTNAGQTCISVERIIIEKKIMKTFCKHLTKKIKEMSSGPNKENDIGPITIPEGFNKIVSQINELASSTKIIKGKSYGAQFIEPTLVINPDLKSSLSNKETFGPIITVHTFNDDIEAINIANQTQYGLNASVFGKNKKRLKFFTNNIKSGSISINDVMTNYGIADLPFGGIKNSGIGKLHGKEGILSFCNQKSILVDRLTLKSELWWYDSYKKYKSILKKFINWYY